jgi:hypothetical protein
MGDTTSVDRRYFDPIPEQYERALHAAPATAIERKVHWGLLRSLTAGGSHIRGQT